MLRVTVELLPAGGEPAKVLHTVTITNDETGSMTVGNYTLELDGKETARLERYPRKLGALRLAQRALIEFSSRKFREALKLSRLTDEGPPRSPETAPR